MCSHDDFCSLVGHTLGECNFCLDIKQIPHGLPSTIQNNVACELPYSFIKPSNFRIFISQNTQVRRDLVMSVLLYLKTREKPEKAF